MAKRWYVVRVQSGREGTVQTALTRRLKTEGRESVVPRVLVPMEVVTELKAGKKRTRKKKLYPGYVLLEVEEDAEGKVPRDVWFLVRETAGVGDFVGPHGSPEPLDAGEVDRLLASMQRDEERAPQLKIALKPGDSVKIKEGPLESFEGKVDEVIPAKGIVRVTVTIFGRETPVELEYWQVESI
ncbi:MAG: transcription termination/antitermination factor NusG [Planctomycetes bacterium]|nr:transcription termination/antitermination factor NusG [Planctomycetota bacterium]MCB9825817.1 transcription termination/antitermination factor NusG [Planctomycetota bacterium]MCB9829102.1 transcription termination/antitermination factor NusG [Planctomycetota bacterium]MCB9901216.1 transcription termination/antitermination factor NusG [Planctomycetota bacterium]